MNIDQGKFSSRDLPLETHRRRTGGRGRRSFQETTILPLQSSELPATMCWLCVNKGILRWGMKGSRHWASNSGKQGVEINVGVPVCKERFGESIASKGKDLVHLKYISFPRPEGHHYIRLLLCSSFVSLQTGFSLTYSSACFCIHNILLYV